MKTTDNDWVEDVRRWYFNGGRPGSIGEPKSAPQHLRIVEAPEIGYEAAHPNLQSSGWPNPDTSGFGALR